MFWDQLAKNKTNIALIDVDLQQCLTYNDLIEKSDALKDKIKSENKKLVFLFCNNSYKSIVAYIALLRSGHAQLLIDSKINKGLRDELIRIYKPEIIVSGIDETFVNYTCSYQDTIGYIFESKEQCNAEIHPDLALLLSTSGTTGSPKLVRLSYKNVQSNADSISNYLCIKEDERPITTLPMSYSYGLSVINSHLLSGASIVLTNHILVLRDFWSVFKKNCCTSFAGVPYSFQLLKKIHFEKFDLPTLRTVTQAGGRLSEPDILYFHSVAKQKNFKFFVMYGQTEATARISYLPFDLLKDKIGSVGVPIPNGEIKIMQDGREILSAKDEGELVYYGKNVMMGYAESRNCLYKEDELKGVLHTNDIGYKDNDGFIYITGRKNRFIKIFGLRINLDEVEKMIENNFNCPAACFGKDDSMRILLQNNDAGIEKLVGKKITQIYKLHTSVLSINKIDRILITLQGKKDYKGMEALNFKEISENN